MTRATSLTRILTTALVAGLVAACGNGGSAPTHTVADSAGVRIVQNRAPVWDDSTGWKVGTEPVLEIGTIDGPEEYRFTNVIAAWQTPDGSLVVVDQPSLSIRVFHADGTLRVSTGRPGEGPGEFRGLLGAAPYRGDSIATWDPQLHRISIFDRDGRLGRTLPISLGLVQVGQGGVSFGRGGVFRGAFGDGSFAMAPEVVAFYDLPDAPRFERPTLRLSPEGDSLGTFGPFPGSSLVGMATPFPRREVFAVVGDHLIVGTGEAFQLHVFERDGEEKQIVRTSHRERPVSEADRDAFVEMQRATAERFGRPPEEVERQLETVVFPAFLPPYSAIQVDPLDHVWVRDYYLTEDHGASLWSVFAPDGRLLGTVETPDGFEVLHIGVEQMIGVWRDALSVPYVRVHSLER